MSLYAPIIRAYRLRACLLQSQAEEIADEDMTAARVLRGIAVADEQVAQALERDQAELAERVRPARSSER